MPTARHRQRILRLLLMIVVELPFLVLFWMQSGPVPIPKQARQSPAGQPTSSQLETNLPAVSTATPSGADDEPAPLGVDELLAKSREKLTEAREAFRRIKVRADQQLLSQFGGREWEQIQDWTQQAELSRQTSTAVSLWQQAEQQLVTLLPKLSIRQTSAQLGQLEVAGNDSTFLIALREASARHPGEFDAHWQQVSDWKEDRWLDLCHAEIQRMSPDDAGFSEIWIAVADHHERRRDSNAARTALDNAWSSASRMTHPVRAAESAFDCLRRIPVATTSSGRTEALEFVGQLINQVRDDVRRSEYLADLSGLAHQQGETTLAEKYLRDAVAASQSTRIGLTKYLPQINRCRVMAYSANPDEVFEVCVGIPKYNGSIGVDPFPANTMAYAHAALAGVRTKNQPAMWRGLLLAEAQQLDAAEYDIANAVARRLLAQVDLSQGQWRRAILTANNLADPSLRASILYPVMQAAPNEVPDNVGMALIELRPTDRGAAPAIAAYIPHCRSSDRSMSEWLDWIDKLPSSSARAAVYLAFARRPFASVDQSVSTQLPPAEPRLDDARSLLEAADVSANSLQDALSRAYAQLWIAICWHHKQNSASYARSCDQLHRDLFQAGNAIWQAQSAAVSAQANRYYADQPSYSFKMEYREHQDLLRRQQDIVECYALLAEVQAYQLHDSHRAAESLLFAARSSHTLPAIKPDLRVRLWSIAESIRHDCELPTGVMESALFPPNNYLRMIHATTQSDLSHLKKQVQLIESQGPGRQFNRADCTARGFVEIARMAAKQNQLDDYRAARRSAVSLIDSKGANNLIRLPLIEADAYAGEFELALQAKRPRDSLPLYGTVSRPLSTLCVELCRANRLADAEGLLPTIPEPFWKLRAMHAIAAMRLQNQPTAEHLDWVANLDDPFLRVAAYCGLALRDTRLW